MAEIDERGNIAFTNKEAVYIAICVSLAQTMVLGKTEHLTNVARALRKKMLKMGPQELDDISEKLSKCAERDSSLRAEILSASHSDLVDTEVIGAINLNSPAPAPPKEKQDRSNPNWN